MSSTSTRKSAPTFATRKGTKSSPSNIR